LIEEKARWTIEILQIGFNQILQTPGMTKNITNVGSETHDTPAFDRKQ
jgi:hypothetical protein